MFLLFQISLEERTKIEEEGNGYQPTEMQELNITMVDASLIGYEIDMLFEDDDEEGSTVNVWCQGKVVSIANENKNAMEIK